MKDTALYVRVSTEKQEEGYSLEFQQERLKAYCVATNLHVKDIFIDGGYSGSNLSRPGLQSLLERIKEFDVIVVYKLDRLSRSQKDTLHLIEDVFLPNNVDFISISESFDTGSAFGRAMVGILSVFSQLERENIKQRMMAGRVQRAKNGLHNGSFYVPIGYRYIDGQLKVDDYESNQLTEAAELYVNGIGARKIERILNQRGYKHSYGEWKGSSNISTTLFNPVYRGLVTFDGVEYQGKHERIFSDDLYIKMLEEKLNRSKGSAFKREHLLTGLLWCGHCGSRVAINNIRGKQYYACYSASKSSKHMIKDPNCCLEKIPKEELENAIAAEIKCLYNDLETIITTHKNEHQQPDTSTFEKQIIKLDAQAKRLMDLYQFGEIDAQQIRDRMESIRTEKRNIESKIKAIIEYDYNGFKKAVSDVVERWDDFESVNEQREYLMDALDKIILISKDEVRIHMKINSSDMN